METKDEVDRTHHTNHAKKACPIESKLEGPFAQLIFPQPLYSNLKGKSVILMRSRCASWILVDSSIQLLCN